MKLFVLVVVAFMQDTPTLIESFPYTSLEACEGGRKEAAAELLKPPVVPGLEFWTHCLEVNRDVKPQLDPKHRDPKSERRS